MSDFITLTSCLFCKLRGHFFAMLWSATEVSNGLLAIDLKRKISLGLMRIHKEVLLVGFMMKLLSVFNKLYFKI